MGKRRKKTNKRTNTHNQRGNHRPSNGKLLDTREFIKQRLTKERRYKTKPLPERARRKLNKIASGMPFGMRGKVRAVARTVGASVGVRKRLPLGFYYTAQIDPFRDKKFKICAGRQSRKEVLFSMLKIGKGKSGPKKRKITQKSKVRC